LFGKLQQKKEEERGKTEEKKRDEKQSNVIKFYGWIQKGQ
jgi:hypothetical protein